MDLTEKADDDNTVIQDWAFCVLIVQTKCEVQFFDMF